MPVSIRGTAGGSVTLSSGAAASDTTLTLPNTTGTVALTASPTFSGTLTATTVTSPASTALTIQSAGTTAMTVDTSQNVGIGTTSPSTYGKFAVANAGAPSTTQFANSNIWAVSNASNADSNISISNGVDHSAKIGIYNGANLYFALDGSKKMRIDSSGNLLVGRTSLVTPSGLSSANVQSSLGFSAYNIEANQAALLFTEDIFAVCDQLLVFDGLTA